MALWECDYTICPIGLVILLARNVIEIHTTTVLSCWYHEELHAIQCNFLCHQNNESQSSKKCHQIWVFQFRWHQWFHGTAWSSMEFKSNFETPIFGDTSRDPYNFEPPSFHEWIVRVIEIGKLKTPWNSYHVTNGILNEIQFPAISFTTKSLSGWNVRINVGFMIYQILLHSFNWYIHAKRHITISLWNTLVSIILRVHVTWKYGIFQLLSLLFEIYVCSCLTDLFMIWKCNTIT